MKHFFTIAFLFVVSFSRAQIVNIPDPVLKNYLLSYPVGNGTNFDANGDGELEVSEIWWIGEMNINAAGLNITDLTGLQAFTSLNTIGIYGTQLTSIDLSGMMRLSHVQVQNNNALTSINFTGDTSLYFVNCSQNNITHVNIRNFPHLFSFFCDSNPNLAEFNAEGALNLHTVSLDNCGTAIGGTEVNLKNIDSLALMFTTGSNCQTLDVSGCTNLPDMRSFASIGTLNAQGCSALTSINSVLGGVNDMLNVTGCTSLQTLGFLNTSLHTLDLSSCLNLQHLNLSGVGNGPTYINIKNGSSLTDFTITGFTAPVNHLNICTDDFEVNAVGTMLSGYPSLLNVNSYCNFLPGGDHNTINGKIKLDLNNNGCDNADGGILNMPVRIAENPGTTVIKYTSLAGNYVDYPYAGNFTLTPYFAYPYFNMSPATAGISFNNINNNIDSANFCIEPNGVHNDLLITYLPVVAARPGFEATYRLVYKNRGTSTQSGSVQLNYDNAKMIFGMTSTPVNSQSPGQLAWNYTNLMPFETRTIDVSFGIYAPPVTNINDTLIYLATIDPVVIDETPSDNSFILPQKVIASWDPNDKQCLEGDKIGLSAIDKPLHYIIHFQNLGTDTAFNIVVADELSDKFDVNSVEIIGSSHPCEIQLKNGKLEFIFQNIRLPYEGINEPASHGFVAFNIKANNSVVIGDSLNNKASVYFDFNMPVITNVASTIITVAAPVSVALEYFSVIKKNEVHELTWKAPSTNGLTIFFIERSADGIHFNNIGNITSTSERTRLPFNFTDLKPLTGKNYYRLKITDADGKSFYSKILVIGNDIKGFQVIAITGDQGNTNIYISSEKEQMLKIRLVAGDGRIIYTASESIPAGSKTINMPLKNVAKGIYTLIVYTNDGEMITKRFIR